MKCYFVVVMIVIVFFVFFHAVVVDPTNLPLKFGLNWVRNS